MARLNTSTLMLDWQCLRVVFFFLNLISKQPAENMLTFRLKSFSVFVCLFFWDWSLSIRSVAIFWPSSFTAELSVKWREIAQHWNKWATCRQRKRLDCYFHQWRSRIRNLFKLCLLNIYYRIRSMGGLVTRNEGEIWISQKKITLDTSRHSKGNSFFQVSI